MTYHAEQLLAAKIPCKETDIQVHQTICAICEGPATSCGVEAFVKDGRIVRVQGDKQHPVSGGTLCSKGSAGRQYVYNPDRILTPLKRAGERGEGRFVPIGWDQALDEIATRLLDIKTEFGPQAVAAFCGYTKWLRPFLQRLIHSFGSPNFMTESSTCYFATALATKLTYGAWGGPAMDCGRGHLRPWLMCGGVMRCATIACSTLIQEAIWKKTLAKYSCVPAVLFHVR